MAEDLAALVIRLSAEGSEKVQKDISAIGANTKVTTDILMGMNNTLKKIERSGLIGLRNEFTKTQTASAQLSDQIKTQQATITALQNKLKTLGSEQVATTRATKDHTDAIEKHGKGIRNLIPHVALVTLSYMAMRRAVKAVVETLTIGASFEHQMSIVGGIVRATTEEFDALSKAALKAGEETVWTATEAANALRYLGMAGLGTEDAIAALGGVLNLALIGEMNLSRATDIATDSLMAFGLKATELDKVVDVFVGTITRSNTNIEALGQAMKFAAPVASQLGYSIEQVSAMIGILSQSGIKAGIAGRALRMSLLRSADAAKELGLSSSNLIEILKELSDRNLAPDELAATMHKLFGIEATPSMLILMKNVAALEEFIDTLNNSSGETDAFIKRLDTVTVAWKEVASVIEDLAITAFLKYADSLKTGLKDLKGWIGDHKEDILGLFDGMVSAGKGIAENLVPALNAVTEALKGIMGVGGFGGGDVFEIGAAGFIGRLLFGSTPVGAIIAALVTIDKLIANLKMPEILPAPSKGYQELFNYFASVLKAINNIPEIVEGKRDWWTGLPKDVKELRKELGVTAPVMNELAVEVEELYEAVRIEAEELGKAAIAQTKFQESHDTHTITAYKNAMADLNKEFDSWYKYLIDGERATPDIQRIEAIDEYTKKMTEYYKKIYPRLYLDDAEKFKELIKYKVDAFTKLYDHDVDNKKKLREMDEKFTQDMGELLSKFTDEDYKQQILKQTDLYQQSQADKLNATKAGSDEAVKIIDNTYKHMLEIVKEGLKNQKDSEKWLLDGKKELYKDDVAEQLKMLDEQYANYLNTHEESLEAFEAYHAMRTKIYADAYKDEANALDTAMAEESKWMDGRIDAYAEFEKSKKQYRNDELQAMKSLYEDLGKISGEYYEAQVEIIERQAEKYIESLHLQGKAYEEMTAKEKALFDAVQQWKLLKISEETVKMLRATGDYIDGLRAYLLQAQIDWKNYYKKIGDWAYESFEIISNASKNMLSEAFKGNFDNVKDLWDKMCDDLLDRFTDFIADLIIEWAKVQLSKLVLGIDIGSGSSATSTTGFLSGLVKFGASLSNLFSSSGTIGKLITWIGSLLGASATSGSAAITGSMFFGMTKAEIAALFGSAGGTGGATGIGAGLSTLSQGGIMGLLAAAWAAGSTWLGEWLMKRNDGPSSMTAAVRIKPSKRADELFSIPELFSAWIEDGKWDSEDQKNAANAMGKELLEGLSAYEQIFQWVGDESKKKLKDFVGSLNLEDYVIYMQQWASEGAPRSYSITKQTPNQIVEDEWKTLLSSIPKNFMAGWNEQNEQIYNKVVEAFNSSDFQTKINDSIKNTGKLTGDKLAEMIGISINDLNALFTSYVSEVGDVNKLQEFIDAINAAYEGGASIVASGGTVTEALQKLFGEEFSKYAQEAVDNIKNSEIFKFMSDEIQAKFNNLDVSNFAEFIKVFGENAAKLSQAAAIWQKIKNLGDGVVTKADQIATMTNAYIEVYKKITESYTGKEMTDTEAAEVAQQYYEALAKGTKDMNRAIQGVTDLDVAVGALNGTFDAYIAQLKALGVDISKITELEEKRAAALSKLLEDYKHQLGLISDEEYYKAMFDKIWETYKSYFGSAEEFIEWFKTASLEDIKALAEKLGIDWTDIANDVGWLIKALEMMGKSAKDAAASFEAWRKAFFDIDESSIQNIAARYGLDIDGMTSEWWEATMASFKKMSSDDFKKYADSLGVSVEQLMSDLDTLKEYFLEFAEQVRRIEEWQASLLGMEDEYTIQSIREKYGIVVSMTDEWLNHVKNLLATMSTADLMALAKSFNVPIDEFIADMQALFDALEEGGSSFKALAKQIRDALAALREDITGISARTTTSLASSIEEIIARNMAHITSGELDKINVNELLHAVQLMNDWWAAVKEDAQEAMDAARDALESQIDAIQSQVDAYQAEIDAIRDQIEAKQDEIEAINELIEIEQDSIDAINDQIEAINDQIDLIDDQIDIQQDFIDALQDQIDLVQDSIDGYNDQIEVQQDFIDAIQDQIDAIEDLIDPIRDQIDVQQEFIDALQDLIDPIRDQIELLQDEIDVQQDFIEAIQDEIDILDEQAEIIREQERIAKLQKQAAERVQSLVETIDDTIKSIKYSSLNVSLPSQKAADIQEDYQLLKAKAFGSDATVADIEKFIGFTSTYLQIQQDSLKSSSAYQSEYDRVMADLEAAKTRAQEEDIYAKIYAELEGEISPELKAIEDQIKALQDSMKPYEDAIEALQDTIEAREKEIEALEDAMKPYEDAIENLQDAIEIYEKQIEALADTMEPFKDAIEGLQDQIKLLEDQIEGFQDAMEPYQNAIDALQDQIEVHQDEIKALQDLIKPFEDAIEAYRDQIELFQDEIDDLQDSIEPLQDSIDALSEGIQSLQDQISALKLEAFIDPAAYAMFESWSAQIEQLLAAYEHLQIILHIDWANYDGTIADALAMLMDLVSVYGWTNTIVLKWTSDMTQWLSTQPIEDILLFLDTVATKVPGGWDSQYMLHLISDLTQWLVLDIDKAKAVLDHLVSIFGEGVWTKAVTLQYITSLLENGITWAEMKEALSTYYNLPDEQIQKILSIVFYNSTEFTSWADFWDAWTTLGMTDSWATKFLKTAYENGWITDTSLKAWADFVLAFKMNGIDDATAEKILAAVYQRTGGEGELALWSDFKAAMADAGIGVDSDAWKTIQAAYNDSQGMFPTWATLTAAMEKQGIPADVLKKIQGQYESGDMTWTELEDMLYALGTPEVVIRKILADVSASTTVTLTELEVWKVQTAILIGILQNTARTALALSGGMVGALEISTGIGSELANKVMSWFGTNAFNIWGAGSNSFNPYTPPSFGGGTASSVSISNWPSTQKVSLYGASGAQVAVDTDGVMKVECYPTSAWSTLMYQSYIDIARTKTSIATMNTNIAKFHFDPSGYLQVAIMSGGSSGTCNFPTGVTKTSDALNTVIWGENKGRIFTLDGALYAYVAYWKGTFPVSVSNAVTVTGTVSVNVLNWPSFYNSRVYSANGTAIGAYEGTLQVQAFPAIGWGNTIAEEALDLERIRANLFQQNTHWLNADVAARILSAYAEGGIVTKPTAALIGEAGYPEAVIPMKDGINIPVKWINGGSTQAGANNDEEVELLREQVRLLSQIVAQNGQPLKIEGLGNYAKAKADEVIVARNQRGKITDTRRYY